MWRNEADQNNINKMLIYYAREILLKGEISRVREDSRGITGEVRSYDRLIEGEQRNGVSQSD